MAIEFDKPLPLMIGDKAYYTLTSYDPVKVEVTVHRVTDDDVAFALTGVLVQMDATPDMMGDPEWFSQHFPDVEGPDTLVGEIGESLEEANLEFAQQQVVGQCRAELARRLKQSVPAAHVARLRDDIVAGVRRSLEEDGLGSIPVNMVLSQSWGVPVAQVDRILSEQAKHGAEENAALDAFARERKLSVSTDELPGLLGVEPDKVPDLISQICAVGQYDDFMEDALRIKALSIVVSECEVTYHHETEAEAKARVAEARRLRGTGGDDSATGGSSSGLHLV